MSLSIGSYNFTNNTWVISVKKETSGMKTWGMDWGPSENKTSLLGLVEGTNSYEQGQLIPNLKGNTFWNPINIKGVNVDRIIKFSNYLNKGGKYNLLYNNCLSMTSRALNMSGVFNIGIHPYLLHAQMYLRAIGVRPMLYSHYLLNY